MRGRADDQPPRFHTLSVRDRVRPGHPLRDVERRADRLLAGMSAAFDGAYRRTGRPSAPPERRLKALLLMAPYSVRGERPLCERIDTGLLFRWVLDLRPSDDVFDATTFTHNRKRLDDHDPTAMFFGRVVGEAVTAGLCRDHSSADGTRVESVASAKSVQPIPPPPSEHPGGGSPRPDANGLKPRNAGVDFRGRKRTNDARRGATDPQAELYRKGLGKEAELPHRGHALGENRHGLIPAVAVTEANGTAERSAAVGMLDGLKAARGVSPTTLGADKGSDDGGVLADVGSRGVEPHVPPAKGPRDPAAVASAKHRPGAEARQRMKARTAGEGDRLSQECRKTIEGGSAG